MERYYDAETFLLAKLVIVTVYVDSTDNSDIPQSPVEVSTEFFDWRDFGNGAKGPHTIKVTMPGLGKFITKIKHVTYNVPIDDAMFAVPRNQAVVSSRPRACTERRSFRAAVAPHADRIIEVIRARAPHVKSH